MATFDDTIRSTYTTTCGWVVFNSGDLTTASSSWSSTQSIGYHVPIDEQPLPKPKRPVQHAAIDPWMPLDLIAAPKSAWPSVLRRFRGNV